jgi:hypothetical protein
MVECKLCATCVAVRATAGAQRESACLYVCVKGEGFRWWDWQSSAHPSHQSSCPWTPSCSFRHCQCLSLFSVGLTDPNLVGVAVGCRGRGGAGGWRVPQWRSSLCCWLTSRARRALHSTTNTRCAMTQCLVVSLAKSEQHLLCTLEFWLFVFSPPLHGPGPGSLLTDVPLTNASSCLSPVPPLSCTHTCA